MNTSDLAYRLPFYSGESENGSVFRMMVLVRAAYRA